MGIQERSFSYYEPLRKLRRYVEEHYEDEISLGSAAEVACLEPRYFSHYFHSKVGICFSDWLSRFRVSKAMELMGTKDDLVLDIALDVGFGSLRTFERAFRKQTSLTPLQFKLSMRPKPPPAG